MITLPIIMYILKALVAGSIFFVWVVRYKNIVEEFKVYGLPSWLRDLVGILKLSLVVMLFNTESIVMLIGSSGIAVLMVAALITHLRVKNPFYKMLPSMSLMIICLVITLHTYFEMIRGPL